MPDVIVDRPVYNIRENSSGQFIGTLVAEDGVTVVPGSALTSLTLTLYNDDFSLTIVNSRDHQNVLNQNGVVVYDTLQTDASGRTYNFVWTISPADVAILDDAVPFERHVALFEWGWGTGKSANFELILAVRNLARVSS